MNKEDVLNKLYESVSMMAWLQIRYAKLRDYKILDKIGPILKHLEEYIDKIRNNDVPVNWEIAERLNIALKTLTKENNEHDEDALNEIMVLDGIMGKELKRGLQKRLLISKEQIETRVSELAKEISRDLEGEDIIVVGILKGAIFFLTDLVRKIDLPLKLDFVEAKSYGSGMESSKNVQFRKFLELDIYGKTVLVVEDIVDTGHTFNALISFLKDKGPKKIVNCVLIDKKERREVDVKLDYVGFEVPAGFLVGYGLDFDDNYRCLPDIFVLEPMDKEDS